ALRGDELIAFHPVSQLLAREIPQQSEVELVPRALVPDRDIRCAGTALVRDGEEQKAEQQHDDPDRDPECHVRARCPGSRARDRCLWRSARRRLAWGGGAAPSSTR